MEEVIKEHVPVNVIATLIVSYSFTPIKGKTMNATYNITNGRFLYTHRDLLYKKHPKLFPGFKPSLSPVKDRCEVVRDEMTRMRRDWAAYESAKAARMIRYSHIWGD
jgi:hypothetical protein